MIRALLDGRVTIHQGDCRDLLRAMPEESVDCVVTSPPYWGLRDYGTATWQGGDVACDHLPERPRFDGPKQTGSRPSGHASNAEKIGQPFCHKCGAARIDQQLGLEPTLGEHLAVMVEIFREVRRVLKRTGVCWLNYGDCYATAPNGRSAADTKAVGNDDRTFRDKPFSTVGAIYDPDDGGQKGGGFRGDNKGNAASPQGRVVAGGMLKPKDLCMVPQRLAIALQEDGWWIRSQLPWVKRNAMPESITDRPASAIEYVFMLTKSARYWYDAEAVKRGVTGNSHARLSQDIAAQAGSTRANGGTRAERPMKAVIGKQPGVTPKSAPEDTNIRAKESWHASTTEILTERNFRNTDLFFDSLAAPWGLVSDADGVPLALDVPPRSFREAHFATFPPDLVVPLIKAGCPADGLILDPFGGAGTVGLVAARLNRRAILLELSPAYIEIAANRINEDWMGEDERARARAKRANSGDNPDLGPLFT